LKAIQDQIASTTRALAVLDSGLKKKMEDSMTAPLSGVGNKVDGLLQDFGYIRETVNEINTRMGKLQQKVVDLENTIKTMQAPPAPPSGGGSSAAPSGPPAGVSSESLYKDALRDKSGGNNELALKEFSDYLSWFGTTDFAPNAQYYIGEIRYNQKEYDEALAAFDKVLEAYPSNSKTADAHLMKGRTLVKMGRRSEAEKEFRAIISASPNSEAAGRARNELKDLGLSPTSRPAARKR
jgi:TolA-binding protein